METQGEITRLTEVLNAEFQKDPVPTYFIDFTKLGLAEITRKKIRKPLSEYLQKNYS